MQGVQLATFIVIEQALGEVEESPQLAQSFAVGFYLGCLVLRPEERAVTVGSDVAGFVNDVHEARQQNLLTIDNKGLNKDKGLKVTKFENIISYTQSSRERERESENIASSAHNYTLTKVR